jgi:hypothetical protein
MKQMGAADGDFDVQKYETDKRNCYCVDHSSMYGNYQDTYIQDRESQMEYRLN